MPRIHLRHEVTIESFLDILVEAVAAARGSGGGEPEIRSALREALRRNMMEADLCGIFSNCSDVEFHDPFEVPDR